MKLARLWARRCELMASELACSLFSTRRCELMASELACSLFSTRRCELMASKLVLLPILYFSLFSSFLCVLSSIPVQMGKVRQIKRNRVIITYLSAFSSITCETSNESTLNIHLKYYFLALIRKLEDTHQMTTMTSRRRRKSRSLKDKCSQAQVRRNCQARDTKQALNRRQPISPS